MPVYQPYVGLPGYVAEKIAKHRTVSADGYLAFLPGGLTLDGSKTRDAGNPDYNSSTNPNAMFRLRAGTLLGKVTSSGKYANAVIGYTNGALTSAGTTLTLASAQHGTEMARRIGATGTFKLTGPPTASGTVRSLTVTYSAISSTSVTITAAGVNEVQTVAVDTIMSAGKIDITAIDSNGVPQTVNVAYNTSWTQTVADIQTALNALLGTSAVACAVTNTHDMTITFSGTNYAALPQTAVVVDVSGATGPTKVTVTRTTPGVDGRFVTGSLIGDTDGSHVPLTMIPDGWEHMIPEDSTDSYLAKPPISGNVDMSNLLPYWPADSSLKQWIRDNLNTYGRFVDTSKY